MSGYGELLWTFIKLGCLTFGGGYAMLPVIEREVVERKGWATMDEMMDYFAVGQVTPGVIAVNVSTFIGYKRKGVLGGVVCTLGFVLPSLTAVIIIAACLQNLAHIPGVAYAFAGIRIAVAALVLDTVIKLIKGAVKDLRSLVICVAAFGLSLGAGISPVFIVLAAGLAGLLLYPVPPPKADEGKKP